MAKGNEVRVCLKIVGHDDPDALSQHLRLEPTDSWRRGDTRGQWTPTYSAWIRETPVDAEAPIDDRLTGLFDVLAPAADHLRSLPAGAEAFLQIACYWREGHNPGVFLSPQVVERAAELGLAIDFDVYCLGPPPSAGEDPDADVVFGSDVQRDGVFLEQTYQSGGWVEVFHSDADRSWTVSAEILDLSLDRLNGLIARARDRLPQRGDPGGDE